VTLPEHRAGDGDRDQVAAVLREAHAEGRLDLDELTERLDAAYRAKTFGELAAVTSDLPTPRPRSRPPGSPPLEPTAAAVPARRGDADLRAVWRAWAVAVTVNVVVWALVSFSAGQAIYFWPMWVAGPWGAVLVIRTLTRPR
jgi:hypothetical protein